MLLATALLAVAPAALRSQEEDPFYYEAERLGWDLSERFRVPGVGIARLAGGRLAWTLGCGFADLERETPITADTLFNIGSISKTVAAWGLMRLVERGEVDLDAPVERYLTRWKLPPSEFDSRGVTLRRLLSHTAGLSLHGYPGFQPGEELPTIEASLSGATNGAGDVRIVLEPGTEWRYSGGGYTIAQLLVEEVSGQPFAEYMREHVLLPLGMRTSDYRWTDEVERLAATPYDDALHPIPGPRFTAQAAASLQTSLAELARFAAACLPAWREEHPVLKAETVLAMQEPQPASPDYGLGTSRHDVGGWTMIGHGGSNEGWQAQLLVVPETGDGLILLTNGSNGALLFPAFLDAFAAALDAEAGGEGRDG